MSRDSDWCLFFTSNFFFVLYIIYIYIYCLPFQTQSDDDDVGGDEMAVNMDGGKMDEFFQEVSMDMAGKMLIEASGIEPTTM